MEETINNTGRQEAYAIPDGDAPDEYPAWFDGKKINEVAFCAKFLREHPMICVRDNFFSPDGWVSDENRLKNPIYQVIRPYVASGVAKKAASLPDAMRIERYAPSLPIYQDRIRLANGTLFLDGMFVTERDISPTVCQSGTPRTRRRRNAGYAFWMTCWSRRIFRRCRNTSDIA